MILRPKSSLQFAEKHIRLSGQPFRRDLFPMMVEPLNTIDTALGKTVLLLGSIQSFKTLTGQISVLRDGYVDGANLGYYFPTKDDVDDFSEDKFTPLWDDAAPCRRVESDNRNHKTKDRMILPHMNLRLMNAGSKGNRNSKTMRRQYLDEAWMYEEGWLEDLAGRMTAYPWSHRRVIPSSGQTAGGELDQLWLTSDQREWTWVCPDCSKPFVPDWLPEVDGDGKRPPGGVRYEKLEDVRLLDGSVDWQKLRSSVRHQCPHCEAVWKYRSHLVRELNASGFYTAQNAHPDPKVIGYHWWAITHVPWEDLVVQYVKALLAKERGVLDLLEDFVRKRLARRWDVSRWTRPLVEGAGKGGYELDGDWGDEWAAAVPIMTIDVQKDHFWAVVRLWCMIGGRLRTRLRFAGRLESSGHVCDVQMKYGVPDHGGQFAAGACGVFVDGNYNPREVQRLAAHYHWYVLRGTSVGRYRHKDGIYRMTSELQYMDVYQGTATSGQSYAGELKYSSEDARNVLANLRGIEDGDETVWSYAADASADYVKQLDSWYRLSRESKDGRTSWLWMRRGSTPDHLFDCEVMNSAAAELAGFVGIDQLASE